ncbi:BON domain-containing protein [Methylobacterium sp. NEAU K]|uniref:BON domain-containing protein n=1 Tax=Methylobacterium sp. NEAU K TaxID=3064946 RepID=UPI0027376061|nr:BON domain-containing protein [Methylobacterium sp. NEAU K]MDP4003325.1 BON domain-containing protein [Methylobacterium sp. NEAU K]
MPIPSPLSAPAPDGRRLDRGLAIRWHVRQMLRRLSEAGIGTHWDLHGAPNRIAPDADLRRRILDAMVFVPIFDPARIGVTVTDGVVTLTGAVDRSDARTAVEHRVRGVSWVRAVVNDIQVHGAPSPAGSP